MPLSWFRKTSTAPQGADCAPPRDGVQPRDGAGPSSPVDRVAFIDVETTGERGDGRITSFAVLMGDDCRMTWRGAGRQQLDELGEVLGRAHWIAGHNLVAHDGPLLLGAARRMGADDSWKRLPVLDTLRWSSICRPDRALHAIDKDYQRDAQGGRFADAYNDPLEDAHRSRDVLLACIEALRGGLAPGGVAPEGVVPLDLAVRRIALERRFPGAGPDGPRNGSRKLLMALGLSAAQGLDDVLADEAQRAALGEVVCLKQLSDVRDKVKDQLYEDQELDWALIWATTLTTATAPTVTAAAPMATATAPRLALPRWVEHTTPRVHRVIKALRATPCGSTTCRWCSEHGDPLKALTRHTDHTAFRESDDAGGSLQRTLVEDGLSDVSFLAVMPTSSGKSVCFQVPALERHETTGTLTVVLSPLQSLMQDQVRGLANVRARVAALHGGLHVLERAQALEGVRSGRVGLLYLSPEQLRNRRVVAALASRRIERWVFDEAHCVDEWGHDLRPDYRFVPRFIRALDASSARSGLTPPPVSLFTATASRRVLEGLEELFRERAGRTLVRRVSRAERTNVAIAVHRVELSDVTRRADRIARIVWDRLGTGSKGSAIVFAPTRRTTEELAEALRRAGIEGVAAYHAGMDTEERREVQARFMGGDVRLIVATSAFGMGVDKPDVRLVVHAAMPGSLEAWVQETGRAGRDGEPAHAVLLWHDEDAELHFRMMARTHLSQEDIKAVLRTVRRAPPQPRDGEEASETVLSLHEIAAIAGPLRGGGSSANALARANASMGWLEDSGLIERGTNVYRVFQGVASCSSADLEALIEQRALDAADARLWRAIHGALTRDGAFTREGAPHGDGARAAAPRVSAEELALELSERDGQRTRTGPRLMRTVGRMIEAGALRECTMYTALLRRNTSCSSTQLVRELAALDGLLLRELEQAAASDGGDLGAEHVLDVNQLVERLSERLSEQLPQTRDKQRQQQRQRLRAHVELLLADLQRDHIAHTLWAEPQRNSATSSATITASSGRWYHVRLHHELGEIVARRRWYMEAASLLVQTLTTLAHGSGKDVRVEFERSSLEEVLQQDMTLLPPGAGAHELVGRLLLLLHEADVLRLQAGLTLLSAAMTVRRPASQARLQFTKVLHEPVREHQRARTLQVHAMAAFARVASERSVDEARELARGWFRDDAATFAKRWLADDAQGGRWPTTGARYRRIVEEAGDKDQREIVTANPDHNLLVLAGPGSGKTRVIVHRVAYLVGVRGLPASAVIVLAYNRSAVLELRRRLHALLGDVAFGVRIHTLHGLAMQLTGEPLPQADGDPNRGQSNSGRVSPGADADWFRDLIRKATRLLNSEDADRGSADHGGREDGDHDDDGPDARERLLAGVTHVFIDEFQDVDQDQAGMISALTGRLRKDARRVTICAVGDDDQNIYSFRGTSIEFIRRFEQDYGAQRRLLRVNYRSSGPIVRAANALIEPAPDRLKSDTRLVSARDERDAATPVRLVRCVDRSALLETVVRDISCLTTGPARSRHDEIAILARHNEDLRRIRVALRVGGVPTSPSLRQLQPESTKPPFRPLDATPVVRLLRALRDESVVSFGSRTALEGWLREHHDDLLWAAVEPAKPSGDQQAPWCRWLRERVTALLGDREETLDTEQNHGADGLAWTGAALAAELAEGLREEQDTLLLGDGVRLLTLHGAKGLEFDHVFVVVPGQDRRGQDDLEATRRLLYVAATRARRSLTLLTTSFPGADRGRCATTEALLAPLTATGHAEQREAREPGTAPEQAEFVLLGMTDVDLGWAGRAAGAAALAELGRLSHGDKLSLDLDATQSHPVWYLKTDAGVRVGRLSRSGSERLTSAFERAGWESLELSVAPTERRATVVTTIERRKHEEGQDYQASIRTPRWHVVIAEVLIPFRTRGLATT